MSLEVISLFADLKGIFLKNTEKFNELIQAVTIKRNPFKSSKTIIQRINTGTRIVSPSKDTPSITIENPFDTDVILTGLTIIPDASFKTKGKFIVTVEQVNIFECLTSGFLTDMSTLSLPFPNEGLTIKRKNKIEVFTWTSDATDCYLTVIAHFQK